MFNPSFDDDDEPVPFGAGLFATNGSRKKPGSSWFKPAELPERTAPQWGGERGFSGIELKLVLGSAAVFGGVLYGAANLVFG